ncbi:hypothetical protein [Labilithrix luteola]|uniref:hypothetical protein n=1 Tax=Labilithrix luteola TaxID=1391654 RepID=UPI0011BAA59D|nr:hypothetical protein [Labilithrix luteola]
MMVGIGLGTSVAFMTGCDARSDGADDGALIGIASPDAAAVEPASGADFVGDCTAATCGPMPSGSSHPTCDRGEGGCRWDERDSGLVSFGACPEAECAGAAPDASVCPPDMTVFSALCGSLNRAACDWLSQCAIPLGRCPAERCEGKPHIGLFLPCDDGGSAHPICVGFGADRCEWGLSCD